MSRRSAAASADRDARGGLRLPARTPAAAGYAMPAEWARHAATWFSWPRDPVTFRDLEAVERAFVAAMAVLSHGERVEVLLPDAATLRRAQGMLERAGARDVRLRVLRTADVWIRDYGPTFLRRVRGRGPRRAFVRWRFNAWGGKYEKLLADDGIPDRLGLDLRRFAPPLVLEGGSIDVDGAGTVLTTEQCLLHPNRNPHLNRAELEAYLRAYLGVRHVVWLGAGVEGDDTDGHVDDLARFVAPGTVVTAYEDDRSDANFAALHDAWRRLVASTDADGRPLTVVRLPMPGPLHVGRRRLPASYANYLLGNRVVLLPTYGPKARDAAAARVLRRCFPGRTVVPIDCREVVYGYGSLHCASQQEPG